VADDATLVKPPQARRGSGLSEVRLEPGAGWGLPAGRVYVKSQRNYTCRPAWRLWRRTPTLLREYRALQACRRLGINVPQVVHYAQQGLEARLVVAEIEGALPLADALAQPGADRRRILVELGEVLARLHAAGWSHGALYGEHILVRAGRVIEVFLIDFEKARRSRRLAAADLARLLRRSPFLTDSDWRCLLDAYGRAPRR